MRVGLWMVGVRAGWMGVRGERGGVGTDVGDGAGEGGLWAGVLGPEEAVHVEEAEFV